MPRILITGGLGFVGSNLAINFLGKGYDVLLFDDLSDPTGGAPKNHSYLTEKYKDAFKKGRLKLYLEDIRNLEALKKAMKDVNVVIHTAAQVAMAPSLMDPKFDFEVNALGSFNVLEAARTSASDPVMGYASTNKVYGTLEDVPLVEKETRWDYSEKSQYYAGITEDHPMAIGGPYGCSKAVGDLYFREYSRTFGMKTFVFRMSATYGELQYATEVHGWVGWILGRAYNNKPINIFGDGKQVRGVLHVSDLVGAFEAAIKNINKTRSHAFNIGGDRENSLSILELLQLLKMRFNIEPSKIQYLDWRKIDQKCFIANCEKALKFFGWKPTVSKEEGIEKMYNWVRSL